MSRFVLLARSPRAIETAWIEGDQTLRAAANEPSSGRPTALPSGPPKCDTPAHGGLPARTALWFWAEPSSLE
jgi:hypothetical protein